MEWITSISWGSVAEWVNAAAVIFATIVATQTVKGYFRQRAAGRESDLAAEVLEAIYRYVPELERIRGSGEWLSVYDVQAPQITEFQIAVRKIEAYERIFSRLEPPHSRLIELTPLIKAVFGENLEHATRIVAHTYDRLFAAKEGIRDYNIQAQNCLLANIEFTGYDLGDVKIGPDRIAYYWNTLLDDEQDTAQMRQQINLARKKIETALLPIVRAGVKAH